MSQKSLSFRFVRDASSLLGAQGLITIVTIGTAVIMARALGAGGRGQFSLAILLPYMLVTFTDFGMPVAGPRFMAARGWSAPDILASHALAGLVRVLIAGMIGLVLIAFVREVIFPGVPAEYMVLGLLQVIPLTVAGFVLPLLLGLGRSPVYSRLLVLSSSVSFGALSVGWVTFGLDVRIALFLQLAAGLTTAAIIWRQTSRAAGGFGRPSFTYLAAAYRFGAGIYASSLANFANAKLILLLINGFNGAVAVGLYTIAQTASDRLYLLADSIGTILLPHVAESPDRNSARLTPIVFRVTIFIVLFASLILALIANWLVPFLFSEEFSGAVPILRLLLAGVVFSSGWRVLSQDLNARGRSGLTAIVNGTAALIGLSIAAVLLPRIGFEGAAWAMIVSSGFSLVAGMWLFDHFSDETQGVTSLFLAGARERELIRRLGRGCTYVLQLGPAFWLTLLRAYFFDGFFMRLAIFFAPFRRRIAVSLNSIRKPYYLCWAKRLQSHLGDRPLKNRAVKLEELGLSDADIAAVQSECSGGKQVVLGEFDHYGKLIPAFGSIDGLVCCSKENARPRERARVTLVATPKGIGIRKEYFGPGAKGRFLRELRALECLRNTEVRVPEVMSIDVAALTLTEMFVPGPDLEQVLSTMGAGLTGAACRARMGKDLNAQEMFNAYISEGARFATQLAPSLLDEIHNQVREAHRHGVELYDIKYGNIIIHRETGLPFLVDFDSSRLHSRKGGCSFLVERDRDIERLNRMFGTSYTTYDRLREKLMLGEYPAADRTYASFYIGHGLRIGPLWDRSIGFGRWHFILKRCLRIPHNSRVLSVGANNGAVEIQLLRDGVAEVVAYERDSGYASQGVFLAATCEWADNRKYNLHYVQEDMREAVNVKGKFDCALALCSLYYLPADEMQRLASAIIQKTPRFVLQCNVRKNVDRDDPDEYRRASVEFAVDLLKGSGFTDISVTAPRGYSRPIVDGVKRSSPHVF